VRAAVERAAVMQWTSRGIVLHEHEGAHEVHVTASCGPECTHAHTHTHTHGHKRGAHTHAYFLHTCVASATLAHRAADVTGSPLSRGLAAHAAADVRLCVSHGKRRQRWTPRRRRAQRRRAQRSGMQRSGMQRSGMQRSGRGQAERARDRDGGADARCALSLRACRRAAPRPGSFGMADALCVACCTLYAFVLHGARWIMSTFGWCADACESSVVQTFTAP
jgi:hypothetical protein